MKYTVKIGSDAMINTLRFIKIGSGIQTMIGNVSQIQRKHGDFISLL
jgi:hypothetical protein